MDDGTGQSTVPTQSSGPTPQPTTPTTQPFRLCQVIVAGGIARGNIEELISLLIPSPYGIQTPPQWVMQTPRHSLFYQNGSSSQHP
ncbi:hypothetical protein Gotri_023311 [Gossypium trilobum]|uniref:Uncharacterized protein n=1 Tax=Gossypium trilobum TaxID=34281 RepID=A0A7J9DIQ9_9ROSI|nr:hypothetical protein [Gossypium trilobum]